MVAASQLFFFLRMEIYPKDTSMQPSSHKCERCYNSTDFKSAWLDECCESLNGDSSGDGGPFLCHMRWNAYYTALYRQEQTDPLNAMLCDMQDKHMVSRLSGQPLPQAVVIFRREDEMERLAPKHTALDGDDLEGEAIHDSESEDGVGESFICGLDGCLEKFTSVASHESHYHLCHTHVCVTCKRRFVSNFLLDVHITENHDSYFLAKCQRHAYRCLIESCLAKFDTPEERQDHMKCVHKFPAHFAFHKPQKVGLGLDEDMTPEEAEEDSHHPLQPEGDTRMQEESQLPAREEHPSVTAGPLNQSRDDHRIPFTICFGRGAQRAFVRRGQQGDQMSGDTRGCHWHQAGVDADAATTVDIENVDLSDIKDCLEGYG